jgi:hypothetical protein
MGSVTFIRNELRTVKLASFLLLQLSLRESFAPTAAFCGESVDQCVGRTEPDQDERANGSVVLSGIDM